MPGRGLRRADLADMARQRRRRRLRHFGRPRHERSASIASAPASSAPSRRRRAPPACAGSTARPCPSPTAFAEYLRVVWLTPDLDALFRGPAGDRRRFLDRLVLAVDAEHGARVNALERALRSRNRILEESPDDRSWLDAVEREVAELGDRGRGRAAGDRRSALRRSSLATRDDDVAVPLRQRSALDGEIDELVGDACRRRRGGPLSGDPARSTAPATGPPGAPSSARRPPTSRAPRPEGIPAGTRLDGRAEGPAASASSWPTRGSSAA